MQYSALTGIRAVNGFSYFVASALSQWNLQSSRGWNDLYLNSCVVTQALSKEKEEEKEKNDYLGQDDSISGSFEFTYQKLLFSWIEVVGKNLNDFLTLLHVNQNIQIIVRATTSNWPEVIPESWIRVLEARVIFE